MENSSGPDSLGCHKDALGRDLRCSNSETKGLAKLISRLKSVSIKQEYFYRTRHSIVASVYHILIESLTLCVWLCVCYRCACVCVV